MKRLLVVGAQHGNERLGHRIARALRKSDESYARQIDFLCGNPMAYRRNVRFIESDLNRSFGFTLPRTYEQRRARRILGRIERGRYDMVYDIHTSRTDVDRFLIVADLEAALPAIAASTYGRVVVMPPSIARVSLIGNVSASLSVEYNSRLARSSQALDEVMSSLRMMVTGARVAPFAREIFYVSHMIPTDILNPDKLRNFVMSEHGFYPVIVGPGVSYTVYKGFAASRRETVIL